MQYLVDITITTTLTIPVVAESPEAAEEEAYRITDKMRKTISADEIEYSQPVPDR